MTKPFASIEASLDAHHRQRSRQEGQFARWLLGFCLLQSARIGVGIAFLALGYAILAGDWEVFSVGNALLSAVFILPAGCVLAWRKIQSS